MTFDVTTEYFNDLPGEMQLLAAFGWIGVLALLVFGAVIAVDGEGYQKAACVPVFLAAIALTYAWGTNFGSISTVQEQREAQFRDALLDNGLVDAKIDQANDTMVVKRVSDDRFFECAMIPRELDNNVYKVVCD